jgi:hypothetical protein
MMLQMLLGGADTGAVLPSAGLTVTDVEIGANADAIINFNNTGTYTSTGNASAPSGTWKNTGNASDYDIMFTVSSGAVTGGDSVGSWINLGTSRSWSVTDAVAGGGAVAASGTVYISRAGAAAAIASCSLSLSATRSS